MKRIYYDYQHKKTGLVVKACRYNLGYEDGFDDRGNPYVLASDAGFLKKIRVTKEHFIIFHKKYIFILHERFFSKIYQKVEE